MEKMQEDHECHVLFTPDVLVTSTNNNFKILVQSGKWMTFSNDQCKILVSEAKTQAPIGLNSGSNNAGSTSDKNTHNC